jgi:hypothetical protein
MKREQTRTGISILLLLVIGATPVYAQTGDIPSELIRYADFVFYNGQVLTADADRDFTVAEAAAVRGNTILAVGDNIDVLRLAGPDTRRIDLKGRSLTPGFIYNDGDNAVPAGDILKDSQWGGFVRPHLGGSTLDQALATLSFIVDQEGAGEEAMFFNLTDSWAGIAMKSWDIATLDEVAPETPIAVYLDSSYSLVNTAMIDLALEKGFPEDHFHLDRDANGFYWPRGQAMAGPQMVRRGCHARSARDACKICKAWRDCRYGAYERTYHDSAQSAFSRGRWSISRSQGLSGPRLSTAESRGGKVSETYR